MASSKARASNNMMFMPLEEGSAKLAQATVSKLLLLRAPQGSSWFVGHIHPLQTQECYQHSRGDAPRLSFKSTYNSFQLIYPSKVFINTTFSPAYKSRTSRLFSMNYPTSYSEWPKPSGLCLQGEQHLTQGFLIWTHRKLSPEGMSEMLRYKCLA